MLPPRRNHPTSTKKENPAPQRKKTPNLPKTPPNTRASLYRHVCHRQHRQSVRLATACSLLKLPTKTNSLYLICLAKFVFLNMFWILLKFNLSNCPIYDFSYFSYFCDPSFLPSFLPSFIHSFIPSFLPSFIPSFLPSSGRKE